MIRKIAGLALGAALVLALATCATTPRNDRHWFPYLAHTTHVALGADHFNVTPVTDWSYNSSGPVTQTYHDASFDYAELRNVWFVLEPQPGSKLAAHTFLMFEFTNDRLLGVTIEARREENEDYSAIRGAFNAYELAYIWGSARDLLTRRAVMLDHEVFVYPLAITDQQKRDLLVHLLGRTHELETTPRWYNTFTSNCTNELAKATQLHWNAAYVLTGLSDDWLFAHHIIPGSSFEDAHRRSDVTSYVKTLNVSGANDDTSFDHALLGELRQRLGTN